MTAIMVTECAALFFLFLCSAFFSSAETAFFSLNPIQILRLRRSLPVAGASLEKMLSRPEQLLSTILIGNTLVNVGAAFLGFAIAEHLYPEHGEAISIPVMTLLLLTFGEVAPKRLAMSRAEKLSVVYTPLLMVLIYVMTPMRIALEKVALLFKRDIRSTTRTLSEDEFLTVVEVGEEEGVLDEEERTMVDGIISLEEMQASDVMTPRVDLIGIDLDDAFKEREKTARRVSFRYLPVYRDSLDHPEGFLDVPAFLLSPERDITEALLEPFFVPETVPLDTLLSSFQHENKRVAFVVDEFGGTAGLVTRGDVLEEIVRDVDNEYGNEKLTIRKISKRQWQAAGNTSLEDVNYEMDLDLEAEGADRIAGWINAQAEHIPVEGETVEAQGLRAVVQRVRHHSVTLVMLEKVEQKPK